ncbi:hypothetical protein ACF0H5_013483 [Mactra antiquata]
MLMGQKYGYRPIPASIDVEEFDIIRSHFDEKADLSVLDLWYVRDDNSVPPQYVLQPIDSILKNYDSSDDDLKKASRAEWQDTFEELRDLLMTGAEAAFDSGQIGGQTKEKYFNSVTHEEIDIGLLQSPQDVNKKCLCFIREIEDLHQNTNHHRALKFIDLHPSINNKPAEIDTEAQDRLKLLRDNDISEKLDKDNIVRLTTKWTDKGGINSTDNAEYLEKLGQAFFEKMTNLIDDNLDDADFIETDQVKEIKQSLIIRNKWSRIFFGRSDILKILENYVKDVSNKEPYVVYGESGTGKTALIAKCANDVLKWFPDVKPVIITRFLGTSPLSSHILLVLSSICVQISEVYGYDKSKIPREFKELITFFHQLLVKVSSTQRPLLILLDSLDQLSPSYDAYTFNWLPRHLPQNVKIIMSFVPSVYNLRLRFQTHFGEKVSNLEPLPVLADAHCMDIIKTRLADAARTITSKQASIVQELFAKCGLPLFSRVMLEEILTWKSYSSVSSNMVSSSLKEALNNFFRRLELHHGRDLVRHALAYITAAREGISEMELLDLLSLDDDVLNSIFLFWLPPVRRLPPFLWTRLRLDLGVFLAERDSGDTEVFTWYHRMFKEAATERYLSDEEMKLKIHSNLAEYFAGMWSGKPKPFKYSVFLKNRLAMTSDKGEEDRGVPSHPLTLGKSRSGILYNKRKLTELPFHLIKCKKSETFYETCAYNYQWLFTKITACGLQPVVDDFELALTVFDGDGEIQALTDTLRIAGCTLNDFPENLALEITGRLMDMMETMPNIRSLIGQCDVEGLNHSSCIVPMQMYEVPISALNCSIEAAGADNGDNILVRKDTRIVSIDLDGIVKKWDTTKATLVNEMFLPKMKSMSFHNYGLHLSRDESFIVCECRPSSNYVYVLDTDSLQIVTRHKLTHTQMHHSITVGKKYVCLDNAVYQIQSGKKVHDLNAYRKVTSNVILKFTMCENYLLMGGDKFVEIYKIEKAKRVKSISVSNSVSCIEVTADGRLAIVGLTIDCAIRLYDICDSSPTFGEEIAVYDPQQSFPEEVMTADSYASQEVSSLSLSNKGGAFVSLVKRKYPIIWSLRNVSTKPRLLRISKAAGPFRYLFHVQFTADDHHVLAAELSTNVMMWDSITGDMVACFQAHEHDVHDLIIGKHSNVAITAPQNGRVINVWDLHKVHTMEEMSSVKQQENSVKNISFTSQSNLIFMTRVRPPKTRKAYHFIDYFGVDAFDLANGKTGTILPFDRYGHVQNITNSKDGSIVVITTGNSQSNDVSVIDLTSGKLLKTFSVTGCKGVKLSNKGEYICILTDAHAQLYLVKDFSLIGSYDDCSSGMFTKTNAFVGVDSSQLIIRESIEDNETLTIDLAGEVTALHYSEAVDMVLVSVDDGFQLTVTGYKTEGFGAVGTLTGVSRGGISDIADDGSICVDTDLQIFELERCKRVKRLLKGKEKGAISSIRLTSKGRHVVFIDTLPAPCVKVCRISDSQLQARCFLHTMPEFLELIPSLDLIVVLSKDTRKFFLLALREQDRKYKYTNHTERLAQILGVQSSRDVTRLELPEKVREALKESTKTQQIKVINLNLNEDKVTMNGGQNHSTHVKSSSCYIL